VRAAVVHHPGPPSALTIEDREPPQPDDGEIAIDVAYAGVGFVDTLLRSGAFPLVPPFVPGIEVTGTVRALGAGVDGFTLGQPVAALLNDFGRVQRAGGYAQVAIAHSSLAVDLPDRADLPRITAALVNGVTAWLALRDIARVDSSDTVVVTGAGGGLGGTVVRLAALLPASRVVGVVSHDPTRAPAECTDVVLTGDLETGLAEEAVDVVIDSVGGHLRRQLFDHLAPFGRLVVLGNASGEDVALSSDAAWHGTRTVTGLSLGGIAHSHPAAVRAALRAVVDVVARGQLAEPMPDIQPLTRVSAVHEAIGSRSAPAKTVLDVAR
jgi:NADPH2:quinone reductase